MSLHGASNSVHGNGHSSAEQLARLLEDASDYREACAFLRRIVARGEVSGKAKTLVEQLEAKLAQGNSEKLRLEGKLREERR